MNAYFIQFFDFIQQLGANIDTIHYFGASRKTFEKEWKKICDNTTYFENLPAKIKNLPFDSDCYYYCLPTECTAWQFRVLRNEQQQIIGLQTNLDQEFAEEVEGYAEEEESLCAELVVHDSRFLDPMFCFSMGVSVPVGMPYFFREDRIGFVADETYFQINSKINEALAEIKNQEGKYVLHTSEMESWLRKYFELAKEARKEWFYKTVDHFFSVYMSIKYIYESLHEISRIDKAMANFNSYDMDTVAEWLEDYCMLEQRCLIIGDNFEMIYAENFVLKQTYKPFVYVIGEDFYKVFNFLKFYHEISNQNGASSK